MIQIFEKTSQQALKLGAANARFFCFSVILITFIASLRDGITTVIYVVAIYRYSNKRLGLLFTKIVYL